CGITGMTSAQCLTRFGNPVYFGVVGDYLVLRSALSTQDSPHAFFVFDKTGTLTRTIKSWDGSLSTSLTPRVSWAGVHTIDQTGIPNYIALSTDNLCGFACGQEYAGPYQAAVSCVYKS